MKAIKASLMVILLTITAVVTQTSLPSLENTIVNREYEYIIIGAGLAGIGAS